MTVDPRRATRGARTVERELGRVENAADRTRATIGRLVGALAGFVGVRQIVRTADSFQNLENRLRLVTSGVDDLASTQERLLQIANRTRSAFDGTVEVFARLSLSARELGRDQAELLQFTESLNKAVILSGASAQEARAGLIQLSQGIASGALRGDELRSVLEQLPVVADVIAKSLGVTRGQLRELGSQGKISANIILDAFKQARSELDQRFGKTVPTLSQSFQQLKNEAGALVAQVDKTTGAFLGTSSALGSVAEAIKVAREGMTGFSQTLREVEEDAKLNSVGAAIVGVQREIARLESREVVSDAAFRRLEQLRTRLDELRGTAREVTMAVAIEPTADPAAAAADQARVAAVQSVVRELENEQQVNRLLTQGRRDLTELTERENELRSKGIELGAAERQRLLELVQANQQLRATFDAPTTALDSLREQNDLLETRLRLGPVAAEARALENQLARDGVAIHREVQDAIVAQVLRKQELAAAQRAVNDQQRLALEQQREQERLAQGEQARTESLATRIDLGARLAQQERDINSARAQGLVTTDQAAMALEDLRLRGLQASTDLGAGFERAFIKMRREAENFGAAAERAVDSFANRATDAIVEFVQTGEFNFRKFADALIADITRIIVRLLVVRAISALGGAVGQVAGTASDVAVSQAQGRQDGGTIQPDRPFVVGEAGPELIVPNKTGMVVPLQQQQPTAVENKVQVVNVQSEDEIPQVLDSDLADDAVVNILARNKDKVQQVVG